MFSYSDPVGTGVLSSSGSLSKFRNIIDEFYEFGIAETGTGFVKLESMSGESDQEIIPWKAHPITAEADDATIDTKRFDFQDEYVEWFAKRVSDQLTIITFTTEFPEYYEALAEQSEAALVAGIVDAIPGANPTTEELFGAGFDPNQAEDSERADRFRARAAVPFGAPAGATPPNPWNNGEKGILCLGQQFNTMGALFNLVSKCAVPNPAIPPSDQCEAVCTPNSCACGSTRNSDPRICARSQVVSRIPRSLSLRDPVGVQMLQLEGEWRFDGQIIDINDQTANEGVWKISRNGRRAELHVTSSLTLNNQQIQTGTQVSRVLDVGSGVVSIDKDQVSTVLVAGFVERRSDRIRLFRSK